jgi:methionyl-tRNA formyltransferase
VLLALEKALDEWLPSMLAGNWYGLPQDERRATWYGRRTPEDGRIDWPANADLILRLIRAATKPHPGAFTYRGSERLVVWQARQENDRRYKGVAGRVLSVTPEGHALVQTGTAPLWLTEYEIDDGTPCALKVGEKLGYDAEIEIHKLWKEITRLKNGGVG